MGESDFSGKKPQATEKKRNSGHAAAENQSASSLSEKADAEKKSGRHVSPVPRSSAEMQESHRDAPLSARRSLHESLLPDRSSPVSIP